MDLALSATVVISMERKNVDMVFSFDAICGRIKKSCKEEKNG